MTIWDVINVCLPGDFASVDAIGKDQAGLTL